MTKQETIMQLNLALAEEYEVSIEEITPDAEVWSTLKLDSLRAMQIIIIVKRLLNVMIRPREMRHILTFEDLYEYIWKKI